MGYAVMNSHDSKDAMSTKDNNLLKSRHLVVTERKTAQETTLKTVF